MADVMQPKEKDFEFPRGDTCPISFNITDYIGNVLDLSTAEIYFTLKNNSGESSYILQKKKSTGGIEIEGKQGTTVLQHDDTAQLNYGSYFYDIQIKSGNYVKTLARGYISLTDEATWKVNE